MKPGSDPKAMKYGKPCSFSAFRVGARGCPTFHLALLLFLACGLVALVPSAVAQLPGFTILPVPNVGQGPGSVAVDPSGNVYIVAQMSPNFSESMFLVDKFNPLGVEVLPFPVFNLPVINLGTNQTTATGIAVDPQGNIYVAGITDDPNMATPGAQGFVPGFVFGFPNPFNAFALKINGATGAIDYFTYLGPAYDAFQQVRPAIAVDRAGTAYVTGTAVPGYPGPVVAPFGGGNFDAFVAKINGAGATPGTISFFSYLGGSNDDAGASIAVDDAGNAYVTGLTYSSNFPVLSVPPTTVVQPTCPQCAQPGNPSNFFPGFATAFVTKLNPNGGLAYSTYLSVPRYGHAIAVDGGGNAYLAGAFNGVSKLSPDASQLVYSTSLPGQVTFYPGLFALDGPPDFNSSIAVNAAGEAWVTGLYEDGYSFFVKLNAAGTVFVYGSADPAPPTSSSASLEPIFLAGEEHDGIAVDPSGNAYVIGAVPRSGLPPQRTFLLQILDGNTPVGTSPPSVVIHPMDPTTGLSPVTLTFQGSVTQAGTTTLTTSTVGPTPPTGFQLGSPPTYYDLTTTALFTGQIQICIHSSGLTATSRLFHNESGVWVDVTTPPVDTADQIICGLVNSLSPFAILHPTAVCATDVSSSVSVTRSGYSYNFITKRFIQTITLKNNSGSPIAGPISLAIDSLTANATLFNSAGTTGCAVPLGSPYVSTTGPLAPGSSASVVLQITDPTRTGFSYSTRVLAGAQP
jgi:hypothetical protein